MCTLAKVIHALRPPRLKLTLRPITGLCLIAALLPALACSESESKAHVEKILDPDCANNRILVGASNSLQLIEASLAAKYGEVALHVPQPSVLQVSLAGSTPIGQDELADVVLTVATSGYLYADLIEIRAIDDQSYRAQVDFDVALDELVRGEILSFDVAETP